MVRSARRWSTLGFLSGSMLLLPAGCGGDDGGRDTGLTSFTGGSASTTESGTGGESGTGEGTAENTGDGDASSTGDGDGDGDASTTGTGTGDGDGDASSTGTGTGDGDGDASSTGTGTGDGDGDASSTGTGTGDGDGDGDPTTSTTGDGDGDASTTGTGDGDGDGDASSTGDGDGDGDGDPSTSTTGDGDGDPSTSTTGDGDGDPSTSTTGDGDGDGDGDGPPPCFELDYTFSPIPPNVLFVLDKSGSMTNVWTSDVSLRKWTSLHEVVSGLLANLDSLVNFGVKLYPSEDAFSSCTVDPQAGVPVALNNGANILAYIPGPLDNFSGSTPTQAGVEDGIAYLNGVYAADPDNTPPQAIILIADGQVSCSQNATDTATAIANAFAQSPNPIRTFVVGIDITGFGEDEMNSYAVAGGTALGGDPQFFQVGDQQALADAMAAIVGSTQTCDVILDPPPLGPDLLEVRLNGAVVPAVTDCATEDGYVFPDAPSVDRITLCGASCDTLKQSGDVNVTYFCPGGG